MAHLTAVFLFVLICVLGILPAGAAENTVIWLEAEAFSSTGGWSTDTQFVDLMGSPYLLANGVGKPVADAVRQVSLPKTGTYRLWVRCKNWLPEYSPGQFQVMVGGTAANTTFGCATQEGWQWVDGGEFSLQAGAIEVRLHDLTGWLGRCDAIVLAAGAFRPSDDPALLARQREQYGGVSADLLRKGPYDVVVVGGGLAGCAAAVSAARHGCKVALVQDRPVLGGNSSSEIQVPVMGDVTREPKDPYETGIIEEFYPEFQTSGRSAEVEAIVRAEKNIDLFLNTRATGVEMENIRKIRAVQAVQVNTGQRLRFLAPLFVDTSGHGWVGYWAGAEYHQGEEARDVYQESLAPASASPRTLSNALYDAAWKKHDVPTPFVAPPWAYQWTSPADFEPYGEHASPVGVRPTNFDKPARGKGRMPSPHDVNQGVYRNWWLSYGGMRDTITEAEQIRDELFRISIGLWDYAKNHNKNTIKQNENREMVWLNYVMGVRESRRLIGDYVLTEHDIINRVEHPDTVAYSGWYIDAHHPEGFWVRGSDVLKYPAVKASIPYRTLYTKDVDNLFMAGRCYSASHIAMSGTRVMRTTTLMGQAVGTAAALATKYRTTPRGIYQKHITELQQTLLKDGCYLMGVPNRDSADLALTATASASSTGVDTGPDGPPQGGTLHTLNCPRAVMFAAAEDRQIEQIAFHLKNERDTEVKLTATLRAALGFNVYNDSNDLVSAEAVIPPHFDGWVEFPLKAAVKKGSYYYALLAAAEGVSWHVYPVSIANTSRAYFNPYPQASKGCYQFRMTPGGEPTTVHTLADAPVMGPENVNNGWNRAVRGVMNAWAPAQDQPLPQWVQLDLPRPAALNCLHVSFQRAQERASDFRIDVWRNGQWESVAEVQKNALRRCVIRFAQVTTTKVRLVLLKAPAHPAVCEIRLYKER